MKSLKNSESAVSPVIAVILMVAITVVLAATVYVWVSGFGSNSSQPAKTIALTSAGAIDADCSDDAAVTPNDYCKSFTVASASPGLRYGDLSFTLDGAELAQDAGGCATVAGATTEYGACQGATMKDEDDLVAAGDEVAIAFSGAAGLSGQTLRVIDASSNSIVLTLVIS